MAKTLGITGAKTAALEVQRIGDAFGIALSDEVLARLGKAISCI